MIQIIKERTSKYNSPNPYQYWYRS
jgi:hypothetical protein